MNQADEYFVFFVFVLSFIKRVAAGMYLLKLALSTLPWHFLCGHSRKMTFCAHVDDDNNIEKAVLPEEQQELSTIATAVLVIHKE